MKITTDKKWKPFKYGYEVPKKIHKWYDWLDEDARQDHWIRHYRNWYHLTDFMRAPESLKPWDGYHADGFSSGTLIRLSRDGEEYMIGTYTT